MGDVHVSLGCTGNLRLFDEVGHTGVIALLSVRRPTRDSLAVVKDTEELIFSVLSCR